MCDLILCPSEENAAYFKFYLMLNFMCWHQFEKAKSVMNLVALGLHLQIVLILTSCDFSATPS